MSEVATSGFFIKNSSRILSTQIKTKTLSEAERINALIVEGIQDKKGKNIVKLDLRKVEDAPVEYFIICEGDSNVHIKAITDSIHKTVKEAVELNPFHIEGAAGSTWVLMDYFSTVVHVFYKDTRNFYQIEDLWSDAKFTEYQNY